MALVRGQRVLRRIFTLNRYLSGGPSCVLWEADPGDGEGVLIKAWPFLKDEPSAVERNLWDRELRTLYRLASTREAERRLVTLIDGAVDLEAKAFVLALKVPGFDRLSGVLANRKMHGWLSDLSDTSRRVALWRGALRLIEGLAHVHRFRSVHRAIGPENVFLDARRGPDSLRLGGFEWSIRLGALTRGEFGPLSPLARANASLNSDWRDLGWVLAGIFGVAADVLASSDTDRVVSEIQELRRLTEDEKAYLRTMVTAVGTASLDRDDIVRNCSDLIDSLETPARLRIGDHVGAVVALRNRLGLSDMAVRIAETDSEVNASDEGALRRWIEDDLSQAEIVVSGDPDSRVYFLKGRRLPYRLSPFTRQQSDGETETTWNLGYLSKAEYIDERRVARRSFPIPGMISVHTVQVAHSSYSEIYRKVRSWESLLPPAPDLVGESVPQISFLRRFLQVTNEIERAIRECEIYPIRIVRHWSSGVHEYLTVEESVRPVALPMSDRTPSMVQYLSDEDAKAAGTAEVEVYVGPESDLEISRRVEAAEFWSLHELPPAASADIAPIRAVLRRFASIAGVKPVALPADAGFLRTRGLFAQVTLVDRRAEAIELLSAHLFLQRALVLPETVYMDTGVDELPLPIPAEASLDHAKRAVLKQIWRTRPVFCLQGPPGTGKTTLVAQLLRQIYEEDPSCQVLLTAQAHSAVDHLRDEVSKFVRDRQREDAKWIAPLAVRLRKPRPNEIEAEIEDSASPSALAREILDASLQGLKGRLCPPQHVRDWIDYAQRRCDDGDFEQLVRRGANFVYCTSTAADLLELAQSNQTFDWSIIEEAGKAHGFDLVLPLQTGHRWLLIGDQDQLPPYREKDFSAALDRLDIICDSDPDLRRFWTDTSATGRQGFIDAAKRWLFFFRELFETMQRRAPFETPLIGMLTEQHRMHPEIGNLISHAFYKGKISNATEDPATGRPLERVLHHFEKPNWIRGSAIVWVNVSRDPGDFSESDPLVGKLLNPREVRAVEQILNELGPKSCSESCAVLTPYRRQLRELRSKLNQKPQWVLLPEGHQHLNQDRIGVFTVDSFQGRQASVVVVSLVRNNTERDITKAFGFLTEHERINVMMSRAEKLLFLVGSWEFFRAHLNGKSREAGQPFSELARLSDWLAQAFESGRATLIYPEAFSNEVDH